MPIDVNKIDGYADMSAEDKVKALEAFEFEPPAATEPNKELDKLKSALSKANSEAADYKRQLREKQTEAERIAAERAEADRALREEIETYRNEKRVAGYSMRLVESGYDPETAAKMAAMLPDGIPDDFFATSKAYIETQRKAAEDVLIKNQLDLSHGAPPSSKSVEDKLAAELRKYAGL